MTHQIGIRNTLHEERFYMDGALVIASSLRNISICVCAQSLCLRHIHHIQTAPIHHIQVIKKKDEIEFTMVTLKYLGVRNGRKTINRKTPVMTLQGLQRLLFFWVAKVAAEFRQIVLGVFTRYMAGTGPWSSWST